MNSSTSTKQSLFMKVLIPLLAITVLLVMVAWLAGSFNDKVSPDFIDDEPQQTFQKTFTVTQVNKAVFEGVAASITAKQATIISSRLLARISKIHVRAGDTVSQGDVLITLEQNDLASKVIEASEQVKAMQARHTEAKQNLQRAQELFTKQIVSQFDLDKSQADYQSIVAELTAAKQSLTQAKTTLSYATLKAPIDGKVVDRFAEPGNTAQAGSKLLSLYNPLSLRVEAQVREALALTLSQGQSIQVELPTIKQALLGQVEEIVPAANTGSRSFLIKIGLPYQERLLPGMYARLVIPAGEQAVFRIPQKAIVKVGQLDVVNLLVDDRSQRRFVRLGKQDDKGFVTVISGLTLGDKVIIPD